MLAISIVNLILSIFGITVSSIFILFWCGRYFCARFFIARVRGSGRFIFSGSGQGRRVVEHNSSGVNPLIIAYFPTLTFRQDLFLPRQDAMCAVCLGEYKEEELLRMLPQCGHNFHVNCIDIWLQQHATCPVCRMSLQGYFVGRTIAPLQQMAQLRSGSQTASTRSDAVPLSSSGPVIASHPRETTSDEAVVCNLPVQMSESSTTCDMSQHIHESNTIEQLERQPTAGNRQGVNERPEFRVVDVGLAHLVERG